MTDLELYFQYRCEKGLEQRGLAGRPEYQKRLEYEISTITKMGFVGYFLVVSDLITWALDNDIPVGPGRGSAAGSLVAYVLEITHLDPIKYGLIFERFLNPARAGAPDYAEAFKGQSFNSDLTTKKLYEILTPKEDLNASSKDCKDMSSM